MGWFFGEATEFDRHGKINRLKEMRKQYSKDTIIKDRIVGKIYYAAAKYNDGSIGIEVVITCVQGNEFGYKPMSASAGPFYYDCPESILKLNTEQDEEALKWIAECHRRNELKKKLAKATEIKVTLPCDTSIGDEGTVFFLFRHPKLKSHWEVPGYMAYFPNCRITQWFIDGYVEITK